MGFSLTEEELSIRNTARKFALERVPISHLRELRDRKDPVGISRDLWREMANLGLLGTFVPEAYGGLGLGVSELGLVLEEFGKTLAPTAFLSTILLSANALLLGGTTGQKDEFIPPACSGERILAFAHEEGTHHAPYRIRTRADKVGNGYKLSGEKVLVFDGHIADAMIVVARTSGNEEDRHGITLFLVNARSSGIAVKRTHMIDSRNAARVTFDSVHVTQANVVGEIDSGAPILDEVLDRAVLGLSAEMLGGMTEAFERTIAYLKDRKQFGVPIGSFQALKHRAAAMFCEIELSKSIVREGLQAIDHGSSDVPILASTAKARTSDAFILVANEAIQMHGGVGVTDELDIGFFLKRARVAEMTLGTAGYHRDRFARHNGY